MGLRFSRRLKILPGIRLNIGKNGLTSVTLGKNGLNVTKGSGGTRLNVGTGIPGLSYSAIISKAKLQSGLRQRGPVFVVALAIAIALLVALVR